MTATTPKVPTAEPEVGEAEHNTLRSSPAGTDVTLPARAQTSGSAPSVTAEAPGRYDIRREQGRGGMGRILVAFDEHVGREIALKELLCPPGAAVSAEEEARFLREARLAGRLEHPNIVPVHEVGRSQGGALYYTMRLVRGCTLAEALASAGGLASRLRRLGAFRDLAHAIAFAHSRGVLHRDLKPANVMVGEFGETVVLDWGLAKVVGQHDEHEEALKRCVEPEPGSAAQTVAGAVVGTPAYMSPEQAAGRVEDIDERSDVWGLGAALYELLCGRPPFLETTRFQTLEAVQRTPLRPVLSLEPQAPPDLAAIAEKALQKDPARRYQTARELAADVEAYMTGSKVAAYRYTAWELLRRFAAEHRAAVAAAAVVVLVALASFGAVARAYDRERQESLSAHLNLAEARTRAAELQRRELRFASASRLARESLLNNPAHPGSAYFSAGFAAAHPEGHALAVEAESILYQARSASVAGPDGTLEAGEALTSVAWSPGNDRLAAGTLDGKVRLWRMPERALLHTLDAHAGMPVRCVSFPPSGTSLVSAGDDGRIALWDPETGRLERELSGLGPLRSCAVAADGRSVATGHPTEVGLWDLASGSVSARLSARSPAALAFSPDGRSLSVGEGLSLSLRRLPSLELAFSHRLTDGDVLTAAAFSPDGTALVAAAAGGRTALALEAETGRPLRSYDLGGGYGAFALSYSSEGRYLAAACLDGTVRLSDAATGTPLESLEAHRDAAAAATFSPDGAWLATAGWDRTARLWRVGSRALPTMTFETRVMIVTASRDGSLIAAGEYGGAIRLWRSSEPRVVATLAGLSQNPLRMAFSADGTRLAAISRRSLLVWEVASGEVVRRVESADLRALGWSPDGQRLAVAEGALVRVRGAASGEVETTLSGSQGPVRAVSFSRDGRRLASSGSDREVRLWDLATGSAASLAGHTDWVSSLEFSPDGRRLVSSGKDGLAIVWDLEEGREVRRLAGHSGWVNVAHHSPDGRWIATVSDDLSLRVWDAGSGELERIVRIQTEVADFAWLRSATVVLPEQKMVRYYPLELESPR